MPWIYCQKTRICTDHPTDISIATAQEAQETTHLLDTLRLDALDGGFLLLDDWFQASVSARLRVQSEGRERHRERRELPSSPPRRLAPPQAATCRPACSPRRRGCSSSTERSELSRGRPLEAPSGARRKSRCLRTVGQLVATILRKEGAPCLSNSSSTAAWSGVASTVIVRSFNSTVRLTLPS